MREIDHDIDTPVYVQLAEILREMITNGEIPPRHMVPSKRTSTQQWGVSGGSFEKAILELKALNMVHTIQGKGTFVSDPAGWRT